MMRTREQMIEATINAGYEKLEQGVGSYEASLTEYRNLGYDVRCWYLTNKKDNKTWIMYGKMKSARRTRKQVAAPVKKTPEQIRSELMAMNTKLLRDLCKNGKIKGYGKMKKDEMIEAIAQRAC